MPSSPSWDPKVQVIIYTGSACHAMPMLEYFVEHPIFLKSVCIGVTGKSTLMNNMFGTQFVEMDAFKGR